MEKDRKIMVDDEDGELLLQSLAVDIPENTIEGSKQKVLRNIELHSIAHKFIEDEICDFREELYLSARKVASREGEDSVITKAHVVKAREFLWTKKKKYDFADGYLGLGGLLAGGSIPHIFDLITKKTEIVPIPFLIIIGIIGGFLLGMGVIAKAKR